MGIGKACEIQGWERKYREDWDSLGARDKNQWEPGMTHVSKK